MPDGEDAPPVAVQQRAQPGQLVDPGLGVEHGPGLEHRHRQQRDLPAQPLGRVQRVQVRRCPLAAVNFGSTKPSSSAHAWAEAAGPARRSGCAARTRTNSSGSSAGVAGVQRGERVDQVLLGVGQPPRRRSSPPGRPPSRSPRPPACLPMSAASAGRSAGMYRVAPSATESRSSPLARSNGSGGRLEQVIRLSAAQVSEVPHARLADLRCDRRVTCARAPTPCPTRTARSTSAWPPRM